MNHRHRAEYRVSVASRRRRDGGFTLVELLIAIFILTILGLMLISAVRETIDIAATGTSRSRAFGTAQSVISRAEQDLSHAFGGTGMRLVAGQDPMGRPFIAFVRTLPEETRMAGGYYSGSRRPESGYDQSWRGHAADGDFRAFGGLCEVCYIMEPVIGATRLYRGVIAPIADSRLYGGINSPWQVNGLIDDMEDWHLRAGGSAPAAAANILTGPLGFSSKYHLLADDVLYFGVEFWDDTTQSWLDIGRGGPLHHWESSPQSRLTSRLDQSWPRRNTTSQNTPYRNMGMPKAVRVVITIALGQPQPLRTRIVNSIGVNDRDITVEDASGFFSPNSGNNFIRIDDEWIEYASFSGNTFSGCKRGARGTLATAHSPPMVAPLPGQTFPGEVRGGLTFVREIALPAGR